MKTNYALRMLTVFALTTLCTANVLAQMPKYNVQDIGTLGGASAWASAMNGSGQIVGGSETNGGARRAFHWDRTVGMMNLGTLGGPESYAMAVNNYANKGNPRCQVAGYAQTSTGEFRGFRWDTLFGMINLGTLPGGNYSIAQGLNDLGSVVGYSNISGGNIHAFLWNSATRQMQDLGTLGGVISYAAAINNNNWVVGLSQTAKGELHGFLWKPNQGMTDLGFLYPSGIDNNGNLYGSRGSVGFWRVVNNGQTYYMPYLPGGTYSAASSAVPGTSSSTGAVGTANTASGINHAVLWLPLRNLLYDLNSLIPANSGWELNGAVGTSSDQSNFYIGGNGTRLGQQRALFLTRRF